MAKALLGYVGAITDRRLLEEIAFLRSRIRVLQSELDQLRVEQSLRLTDVPAVHAEPVPA